MTDRQANPDHPASVAFFARTDPGMRRKVNEDAFATAPDHGFCIVCDGMGGHASGEVASTMAVDIIDERLKRALPPVSERVPGEHDRILESLPRVLLDAVREANAAIFERGRNDPRIESGRNMGTTLLILCVVGDRALLVHIGDSRIYRVRGGTIEALTEDHSVTAHQAATATRPARKRKFVTRALGTRQKVVPEIRTVGVQPGDYFVLCSDGLTDYVRDDELARFLTWLDADEVAEVPVQLVALANKRGGRDNITVVIVAASGDDMAVGERTERLTDTVDMLRPAPDYDILPPPDLDALDPDEPVGARTLPTIARPAPSEPGGPDLEPPPPPPEAGADGDDDPVLSEVMGPLFDESATCEPRYAAFAQRLGAGAAHAADSGEIGFAPPPEGALAHRELTGDALDPEPPPLEPPPLQAPRPAGRR